MNAGAGADISQAYGGFQIQKSNCTLCCGNGFTKTDKFYTINGKQITKKQLKSTYDPINLGLTRFEYSQLVCQLKKNI